MVCRAAAKVHDQVKASARPDLPVILQRIQCQLQKRAGRDRCAVHGRRGLPTPSASATASPQIMSYWAFSDVFEEQGVVKEPFYGGYGVMAEDDIPKPAFNAFKLLHKLGDRANRGRFEITRW